MNKFVKLPQAYITANQRLRRIMCVPIAQSFVAAMRERFKLPKEGVDPIPSAYSALSVDDQALFWKLCNKFLRTEFSDFPTNLYEVFEFHVLTNGYAMPTENFRIENTAVGELTGKRSLLIRVFQPINKNDWKAINDAVAKELAETRNEKLDLHIEEEWNLLVVKISSKKTFLSLAKEHGDETAAMRPAGTDARLNEQKMKRIESEKTRLKTKSHRIKRKFYIKGRLPRGS